MLIRTAMILAAGRGERMRPLTDKTPKPLLRAGGRALIDYSLLALARAGVERVVVNLAWLGEQVRAHVGDGSDYGLQVEFSPEPPGALDTGGGIHQALPLLGEAPFWLVNGDVYCEFAFPVRELPSHSLAHLVLVPNPAQHPAGDFGLDGGRVLLAGGERLTYSGLALISPRLFDNCVPGRFPLAPLLTSAIERGRVSGEKFTDTWSDVGTPERLESLDRVLGAKAQTSR